MIAGTMMVSVQSVEKLAAERNLFRSLYEKDALQCHKLTLACRIMLRAFDELGHTSTSCPITAEAIATIRELSY